MSNQEAWDKFVETGRVDYYLLSRGIDIYAQGYVARVEQPSAGNAESVGGDSVASEGGGNRAECCYNG